MNKRGQDRPVLDRRGLLVGGLVAASAAAVAGRLSSAGAQSTAGAPPTGARQKFRPLKSLKFGMIGAGETVEDKFRIARQCGFDGVELDSPGGWVLGDVLRARDATGLQIPGVVNSVHWSKPLSHPEASVRDEMVRALETSIRDCHALGATTVLLVPAVVSASVGYGEAWDRARAGIERVLGLAQELSVRIAIENVWNNFLLGPIEARSFVDSFPAGASGPTVGWYLDVGNLMHYGWGEHWARVLGARVMKVDVKGYSKSRGEKQGRWAGFGVEIGQRAGEAEGEGSAWSDECDWPATLRELREAGYGSDASGPAWFSAEVGGGDAARLADVAQRMDRVLAS